MTIIDRFFSKFFNRLFPELQEGDIVNYRGQKQRVIGSWCEMSLDHDYGVRETQVLLLSCHGQLPVTMDNRLLIRKLGHEPVPTLKIGDRVSLKELESYEWYWIARGSRTFLAREQISGLFKRVGTVVKIDSHHPILHPYNEPTIHVRFDDEGYEITLHPCFLDIVPDYDIV